MTRILLLFISLSFMLTSFAQEAKPSPPASTDQSEQQEEEKPFDWHKDEYNLIFDQGSRAVIFAFDNRSKGVSGSPYWTDDWAKGDIQLQKGNWIKDVQMVYNVYDDQLLVRVNGQVKPLAPKAVRGFNIEVEGQTYEMRPVPISRLDRKIKTNRYSAVLYEGENYQLLYQPHKKFEQASQQGAFKVSEIKDEYKDIDYYFLSRDKRSYSVIKLNQRSLMKALPEKKDFIKTFVKKNKLNVRNTADMIKVLRELDKTP